MILTIAMAAETMSSHNDTHSSRLKEFTEKLQNTAGGWQYVYRNGHKLTGIDLRHAPGKRERNFDRTEGRYWWLQLNAATPGGSGNTRRSAFAWAITNALQGFEGNASAKANGWGQFIDGPTGRLLDLAVFLGPFTVNPDSTVGLTFAGLASPGIGALAASNAALPWTNLSAAATANYSFSIGIQGPSFQSAPGQAVFLDPNGPLQAATHSLIPFRLRQGPWLFYADRGLPAPPCPRTGFPCPPLSAQPRSRQTGRPPDW